MKRFSLLVCVMLCLTATKVKAQASASQAQAIFIYNFTRLIEWPNKDGDFVIANIGSNELHADLEKFTTGKRVGAQRIVVKKYKDVSEIEKCNIIIVGSSKTSRLQEIIEKIGRNHTLIVTEKAGSLDLGSAINFVMNNDKLKFELRSANTSKHGLKISSQLESMAILR